MSLFQLSDRSFHAKARTKYPNNNYLVGKVIFFFGIWLQLSFSNSYLFAAFKCQTPSNQTESRQIETEAKKANLPPEDNPANSLTGESLLTSDDLQAGWIALWDQSTTFGWRNTRSTSIENGVWTLNREPSVVRTAAEFTDFELMIQYSLGSDSEAELLLRTNPVAKRANVDHLAIKLNTNDDADFQTQTICFIDSELSSEGRYLQTSSLNRGYIGFRVNKGQLRIKSVKLRPRIASGVRPISGENRWVKSEGDEGTLSFTDQRMSLSGGPFYLTLVQESASTLTEQQSEKLIASGNLLADDFLLRFQCKASESTNSGIFFRCIPGEQLNGYEAQINNQYIDGDRSKPADCGTGGIFRRSEARRIIANPDQWFSETIIVNGTQISVWVNGFQVTDWSDQRLPHANPRKGKRLAAGEIQIQSHDPETEISFSEMEIAPYPIRTVEQPKLRNR